MHDGALSHHTPSCTSALPGVRLRYRLPRLFFIEIYNVFGMECTEVDETFTSNNDHTGCIRNEALYHDSVVEVMFSTGGALYVSFGISAFFTIVCGFMQYNRENAPGDSVGQIKRWQVFVKSAPQGFSFGSEMFLVSAMLYTSPGIAAVMIIFRMAHPVAVIYILLAIWSGPRGQYPIRTSG